MRLIDRAMRAAVRAGLARRSTALIETTGRTSGQPRVTPLTNGLDGDTFWIVTEHGRKANYVRNLMADPRVRVKAGRAGVRAPPRSWRATIPRLASRRSPSETRGAGPTRASCARVAPSSS